MEWSAAQVEKFVDLYTTKAAAADAIGVSRTTLYSMLKSGADKTQTLAMQQAKSQLYSKVGDIVEALADFYDVSHLGDYHVFTLKDGVRAYLPPCLQLHKDLEQWSSAMWSEESNQWSKGTLFADGWRVSSLEYVATWTTLEDAWRGYLVTIVHEHEHAKVFEKLSSVARAYPGDRIAVAFKEQSATVQVVGEGGAVKIGDGFAKELAADLDKVRVVEVYRALCAIV